MPLLQKDKHLPSQLGDHFMLGQIMRETIQPCINYFKEFGTFVGEG
jgi:hypothetical protein